MRQILNDFETLLERSKFLSSIAFSESEPNTLQTKAANTTLEELLNISESPILETNLHKLESEIHSLESKIKTIEEESNALAKNELSTGELSEAWEILNKDGIAIKNQLTEYITKLESDLINSQDLNNSKALNLQKLQKDAMKIFSSAATAIFSGNSSSLKKQIIHFFTESLWNAFKKSMTKKEIEDLKKTRDEMKALLQVFNNKLKTNNNKFNRSKKALIEIKVNEHTEILSQYAVFLNTARIESHKLETWQSSARKLEECNVHFATKIRKAAESIECLNNLEHQSTKVEACSQLYNSLGVNTSYSEIKEFEALLKMSFGGEEESITFEKIIHNPDEYLKDLNLFNQEVLDKKTKLDKDKIEYSSLYKKSKSLNPSNQ